MAALAQRSKTKPGQRTGGRANGRRPSPSTATPDPNGRFRVRRFDADRQDREISLTQALATSPSKRQLLWIDVVGDIDPTEMDALAGRFDFDPQTRGALEDMPERPQLAIHGAYFHLSVGAEPGGDHRTSAWLHAIAGRNVVITRRAGPVALLDDIDGRIKSDTTLGAIAAAEFVAVLLDAVVTSYFAAVDEIEDEIDRLDERSLRDDGRRRVLDELVVLRRRIARLRRMVAAQRSVFAALIGPDMRQFVGPDAAAHLAAVGGRFESAVGAIEASREALLGSFDMHMTQTAQRTNDVMKVLTIATVLLLPGSLIAGLLGMNVTVPLDKDSPLSFWLVLTGVALLAVVVLWLARRARWI